MRDGFFNQVGILHAVPHIVARLQINRAPRRRSLDREGKVLVQALCRHQSPSQWIGIVKSSHCKDQDTTAQVLRPFLNLAKGDVDKFLCQLSDYQRAVAARIALRSILFAPAFYQACDNLAFPPARPSQQSVVQQAGMTLCTFCFGYLDPKESGFGACNCSRADESRTFGTLEILKA